MKPKYEEKKRHPVQVMLSDEEKTVFELLLESRRSEIESTDLTGPALVRWLIFREARERGLMSTPHSASPVKTPSSPPSSMTPPAGTPKPSSPPVPTHRSPQKPASSKRK